MPQHRDGRDDDRDGDVTEALFMFVVLGLLLLAVVAIWLGII